MSRVDVSQVKDPHRIFKQQFSFDRLAPGQPSHREDGLRTLALRTGSLVIAAIATVDQLVLVAGEKVTGEVLVAPQRVEP